MDVWMFESRAVCSRCRRTALLTQTRRAHMLAERSQMQARMSSAGSHSIGSMTDGGLALFAACFHRGEKWISADQLRETSLREMGLKGGPRFSPRRPKKAGRISLADGFSRPAIDCTYRSHLMVMDHCALVMRMWLGSTTHTRRPGTLTTTVQCIMISTSF